jgi:hypothetical protein
MFGFKEPVAVIALPPGPHERTVAGSATNDHEVSSCAASPSGQDAELGCGARRLPTEAYEAEDVAADSLWGHRGAGSTS